MNIKTKALAVLCALLSAQAQAVIYQVDVWKNEQTGQTVYACSDAHVDTKEGTITKQQQDDLIAGAKKLDATCIVEDMTHFTPCGSPSDAEAKNYALNKHKELGRIEEGINIHFTKSCSQQLIPNWFKRALRFLTETNHRQLKHAYKNSPLAGLVTRCVENDIPVVNAEIRQIISATEADSDINALLKAHSWLLSNLAQHRGKNLNWYYTAALAQYTNLYTCLDELNKLTANAQREEFRKITEKINYIVGMLIVDTNILKALNVIPSTTKNIFIIAGGNHIDNISEMLPVLDYKKIKTYGKEDVQEIKNGLITYHFPVINFKTVFGLPAQEPAHTQIKSKL